MRLLWTAVLLCVHQVFGVPGHPPGEAPDIMLELLKSTYEYKTEHFNASSEAGEPLLLTPYILKNQTTEAREAARVDPSEFLGMESYAGYLTVNEEHNSNMWFWYFPVSGKPVHETPWILWLAGGPGVPSLASIFMETGPFAITGDHLEEMKYSWGRNHSLLFIDNPVGTGFSFTDDKGYSTDQTMISENLYEAFQQFLTIFPELRQAPLTIAGDSYAGKHVPSLGIQIHRNKDETKPINLQGLSIGNGLIDPETTFSGSSKFLREVGVLDDKQADQLKNMETELKKYFTEGNFDAAYRYHNKFTDFILINSHLPGKNLYNFLDDKEPFDFFEVQKFTMKDNIRRTLHVGNATFGSIFSVYLRLIHDIMRSAKPWLEELLENYKVLLYNGHLDIMVGYRPAVNTYNALNFSGAAEYQESERKAWFHNGIVAGYYKIGGNLTEVMVRGAGHAVPVNKPSAALGLISAFARGLSLDKDTGYLVDDTF